jgi:hypothetical protein
MSYLSEAEQRQRIAEILKAREGIECPELVVEHATPEVGGGWVCYRCKKDAPVNDLILPPEQAAYVGIAMSLPDRP